MFFLEHSVERRLREKSEAFVLKPHLSGKSDVWENFSLSVQCYACTEYKFTCVCLSVGLCVRHTFCQLDYTGQTPQRIFIQLIA